MAYQTKLIESLLMVLNFAFRWQSFSLGQYTDTASDMLI